MTAAASATTTAAAAAAVLAGCVWLAAGCTQTGRTPPRADSPGTVPVEVPPQTGDGTGRVGARAPEVSAVLVEGAAGGYEAELRWARGEAVQRYEVWLLPAGGVRFETAVTLDGELPPEVVVRVPVKLPRADASVRLKVKAASEGGAEAWSREVTLKAEPAYAVRSSIQTPRPPTAVALAPDGARVAAGVADGRVMLYDAGAGTAAAPLATWDGIGWPVTALALLTDAAAGGLYFVAAHEGAVVLGRLQPEVAELARWSGVGLVRSLAPLGALARDRDEWRIAAASDSGLEVWRLRCDAGRGACALSGRELLAGAATATAVVADVDAGGARARLAVATRSGPVTAAFDLASDRFAAWPVPACPEVVGQALAAVDHAAESGLLAWVTERGVVACTEEGRTVALRNVSGAALVRIGAGATRAMPRLLYGTPDKLWLDGKVLVEGAAVERPGALAVRGAVAAVATAKGITILGAR